jgi:carbon starvation protein CstA
LENKSPWKILIAEISYFMFILIAIYAGFVFWKATKFSNVNKDDISGTIFSIIFLVLFISAMIPVFLLSLRRMLLKYNVISEEDARRFLWSRTWFTRK